MTRPGISFSMRLSLSPLGFAFVLTRDWTLVVLVGFVLFELEVDR